MNHLDETERGCLIGIFFLIFAIWMVGVFFVKRGKSGIDSTKHV